MNCIWLNFVFYLLFLRTFAVELCRSKHFQHVIGTEDDDYLIFGLTQDCQIFFIRPSQISLLSSINVNTYNNYCYPNLVQLHVKSADTLMLLIKQAGDRICSLEVQIPDKNMLFGDHLFSYSLLASLSYSACSHSPPHIFSLEPDLSYLDSVYNDVVYFVDGKGEGDIWNVHQFLLTEEGYLRHLETIPINNHAKPEQWNGPILSKEYILALDTQRNYLFKRNRFETSYLFECAFDLMYRPDTVAVNRKTLKEKDYKTWLNGMAADGNILMYSETDRSARPPVTRLYAVNVSDSKEASCLGSTPFSFDLGVVRSSTLTTMRKNILPQFDSKRATKLPEFSSTNLKTTTMPSEIARPRITPPAKSRTTKSNEIFWTSTQTTTLRYPVFDKHDDREKSSHNYKPSTEDNKNIVVQEMESSTQSENLYELEKDDTSHNFSTDAAGFNSTQAASLSTPAFISVFTSTYILSNVLL